MDQLLIRFRTNTTAVIAVATGAATFFGFSQNPKGGWYIASLVSYGIAAVIAAAIYWPKPWKVNVAHDVEKALSTPPATTVTKLRWDLARGHQTAVTESLALVEGRTGQATKFRVLVIATAAVVICAGLNSLLTPKPAIPATHIVFDNPTHVISDNPAHVVLDDPAHVVLDPTHVDTDPIHITIDPSGAVVDPAHIDIGKKDGK
jgi:hypothetical protein